MGITDWKNPPTERELEHAARKGGYSQLSPLEKATRQNVLNTRVTMVLMAFFVGWLLAATFWDFDLVDFNEGSFTAVTSEQVQEFEKEGTNDLVEFMRDKEAVFYWDDIAQFYVYPCHKYGLPHRLVTTLVPMFDGGSKSYSVERVGVSSEGCEKTYLLTEQIRPGTIPGTYRMKISFFVRKPIGGEQQVTVDTGVFTVAEKRPESN